MTNLLACLKKQWEGKEQLQSQKVTKSILAITQLHFLEQKI